MANCCWVASFCMKPKNEFEYSQRACTALWSEQSQTLQSRAPTAEGKDSLLQLFFIQNKWLQSPNACHGLQLGLICCLICFLLPHINTKQVSLHHTKFCHTWSSCRAVLLGTDILWFQVWSGVLLGLALPELGAPPVTRALLLIWIMSMHHL